MADFNGSIASRVTRGGITGGGKRALTEDARATKKRATSYRSRGRRGANNTVVGSHWPLKKPMKWPGKITDMALVEVDGKELKAIILTDDMIYHCELRLGSSSEKHLLTFPRE